MCDFSGRLIAWLDRELPAEESAEVENHLEVCSDCRGCVDAYKRVSGEFNAYCDEIMALTERRGANPWTAVTAAAGAVATLFALFLVWPRTRVQPPVLHLPQTTIVASPAVAENAVLAPIRPIQRFPRRQAARHVQIQPANSAPSQNQNAYLMPDEPVIQIAIPAEEMFPPGAVPQGMHFVADVTIAADGSAERLRLRPRLVGFERSTVQP